MSKKNKAERILGHTHIQPGSLNDLNVPWNALVGSFGAALHDMQKKADEQGLEINWDSIEITIGLEPHNFGEHDGKTRVTERYQVRAREK